MGGLLLTLWLGCCFTRQVAGTTGKVHLDGGDDEEGASTEEQGAAILAAFGFARRNEVCLACALNHRMAVLWLSSMQLPTRERLCERRACRCSEQH